jgi:hypothetical protein
MIQYLLKDINNLYPRELVIKHLNLMQETIFYPIDYLQQQYVEKKKKFVKR